MIKPRFVLLILGAAAASCHDGAAEIVPPKVTIEVPPAPTPMLASASAPPAASAPPVARTATPCTTKAACGAGEVCCLRDDLSARIEFCAPRGKPAPGVDAGESESAACAAAAPPEAGRPSAPSGYRALSCAGSIDCAEDEICVLGTPAANIASCVKKNGAPGEKELCGRGACKTARTACHDNELVSLRTCEPTTLWRCGSTSCAFPDICCASRFDAHCQRLACSNSEGPAWACSDRRHCGEGQVCCLSALGQMGSQCVFRCGGEMDTPTCTKDTDCTAPTKCRPLPSSPVKGVKACLPP